MKLWRFTVSAACTLVGLIAPTVASAQTSAGPVVQVSATAQNNAARAPLAVALDAVNAADRDRVAKIMRHPTIIARGTPEEFPEGIYAWLLQHPDRASLAWRRLGIQCAEITRVVPDRFGWSDGQGTEVAWRTVLQTNDQVIWFAEGHTRLNAVSPVVPVKAVVVLNHPSRVGRDGKKVITHETDIYLQTDSKAAALVMRVLGPATPRLAEQGASQLLLFFSGLTRYFDKHPEDIGSLLAAAEPRAAH